MFGIDDAIGGVAGLASGLIGMFGGNPRQKYQDAAFNSYKNINPNITAGQVGGIQGTAYNQMDPSTRAAMAGALSSLQSKYNQGGMDAIDRGKQAEIEQSANQNTQRQKQGAIANAAATNTLNSGSALGAQILGAQGAGQTAAMQSTQNAANAEQARQNTLKGIVSTAGTMQKGDMAKANANDALNQFNKNLEVGNANRAMQAQQDTVQNQLGVAGGESGIGASASGQNPTSAGISQIGETLGGAAKASGWNPFGGGGGGESAFNWNDDSDQGWKTGGGFGGGSYT